MQLIVKTLDVRDDEKNVYVEGYASAAVKDMDNEIISEEALQKVVAEIVKTPYNKLFLDHAPWKREAPATEKIPIGVIVDAKLVDGKLWIKAKLNKAHPHFEVVYRSLRDKFIDAFSIGFKTLKAKKQGDRTVITDLKVLEVSLVGIPANPEAVVESVYEKQFKEDDIEEKHPRAGGRRHRALNRIATRLVKLGKLGLRKKCLSCDDDDDILSDYETKAESECKPPEETGGRMEAETCSGWVNRSGRELTWAEFKRWLARALGIQETQYVRNILYAAWRQGLISTEEARSLGLRVREEDREKKLEESDSLKSLKVKEEGDMQENELVKKIEELEDVVKKLKEENEELKKRLSEYEAKEKKALVQKIKRVANLAKVPIDDDMLEDKNIAELKITLGEIAEKLVESENKAEKVKTPVDDSGQFIETKWGKADVKKLNEIRRIMGVEVK